MKKNNKNNFTKLTQKKGVSLIVLIVTIIVVIILAAAVILTVSKNNPIESAKEARFKEDMRTFQDELNMVILKQYVDKQGQRDEKITALKYTKGGEKDSVYTYLSSFTKKYENKIVIKEGELVYVGLNEKERQWVVNSGIYKSKKITVHYKDGYGNKLQPSEEYPLLDVEYHFDAADIEGYMPLNEVEEGIASSDIEITFNYCAICNDLAFIGLDSSGNETTVEENIVAYTVSGMGECNNPYVAIPREHNGKTVTKIKAEAFKDNSIIEGIIIGNNIETIGGSAFWQCKNLVQAKIDAKTLENYTFRACSNLEKAVIGKNVSGGAYVFGICNKLSDLTIYSENLNINNVFIDAGISLKEIKINEDNNTYKSVDGVVYSKDGTKLYAYPQGKEEETYEFLENVKVICDNAFYCCANLKYINIPETIENVGGAAFYKCTSLLDVNINANTLGVNAFRDCTNLQKAVIGENVSNANRIFGVCNKLSDLTIYSENLNINNSVIDAGISLKEIKINQDNNTYKALDGVVYSKDGTKIYAYPQAKEGDTYEFSENIKIIGENSFQNCRNLKYINIPETVENVEGGTFWECTNLTEANINSKTLGRLAFYNCKNLKKVVIGRNLQSIVDSIFQACSKLTEINYLGTIEEWNNIQKPSNWNSGSIIKTIKCTDGDITL